MRVGRSIAGGRAPLAALSPVLLLVSMLGCGGSSPPGLDAQALRDPAACQSCHPNHYDEWSGSMHAYASDDPVFLAMNRRAQRETAGALGSFCVNCHAPLAVREGLTTDGLNLEQLPRSRRGVTCYFCHATESLAGTHSNNPLVLARDDALFGPFDDPVSGTPHRGQKTALFDDTAPESAAACGTCHDIVNQQGAHVERTFEEWQGTLFAQPPRGLSCAVCHMEGRDGAASTMSTRVRRLHRHDFPAVDLALAPWPRADELRTRAQEMLDGTLQSTVCFNPVSSQIEVTLDNVGAGHGWPSGATPDRRAWVEVNATVGDTTVYASGGAAAMPLERSPDPDLWLLRDCLFDGAGQETALFWQAARVSSNQLPGSKTANINDPASFAGHVSRTFPSAAGVPLPRPPERITMAVHLQAIGDDVLDALIASGDLAPEHKAGIAKFDLRGAAVEWTAATATAQRDAQSGALKLCVSTGRFSATTTPGVSHAQCQP